MWHFGGTQCLHLQDDWIRCGWTLGDCVWITLQLMVSQPKPFLGLMTNLILVFHFLQSWMSSVGLREWEKEMGWFCKKVVRTVIGQNLAKGTGNESFTRKLGAEVCMYCYTLQPHFLLSGDCLLPWLSDFTLCFWLSGSSIPCSLSVGLIGHCPFRPHLLPVTSITQRM